MMIKNCDFPPQLIEKEKAIKKWDKTHQTAKLFIAFQTTHTKLFRPHSFP